VNGKENLCADFNAKSVKCVDGEWQPVVLVENGVAEKCLDKNATSVTIPEGVTAIGDRALKDCKSLSSVVIPSSVTKIGNGAFKGCNSLSSVEFGGTVAQLEAVKGKLNLCADLNAKSVKCADGEWQPVVLVENGVVVKCLDENATSVTFPEGVTAIGDRAFYGCKSLSSVVIPSSVTGIGCGAFKGCKSLSSVEFGGTVAQLEAVKGKLNLCADLNAKSVKCSDGEWQKPVVLVKKGVAVECLDRNATSVTIPENVTEIGENAFKGCKSLASVEIPSGVTAIGDYAFYDCKSLSSVAFGGTVAQWEAVEGKQNLWLYFNAKCVKCADGEWQKPVVLVENGVAVKCLDKNATSVTFPEGVTKIGGDAWGGAFEGCKSLSSVEIPSSVTEIGKDAFRGCSSLSSVVIPSSVKKIGEMAFEGCYSLSSVEISKGVKKIGYQVFRDCYSLTSLKIPSSVKKIGEQAFYGCKSLSSVEIPSSVTEIGDNAFYECKSLSSVEIPSSVTKIDDYAFSHCESLSSVVIPPSVTEIGRWAFDDCKSLASVEFGGTVAQWEAVEKGSGWHKDVPAKSVKCSDGEVRL